MTVARFRRSDINRIDQDIRRYSNKADQDRGRPPHDPRFHARGGEALRRDPDLGKKQGRSGSRDKAVAYGQYTITEKSAGSRSITSAETIDAHFGLGEDADRFADASFTLEFTDKILPENAAAVPIFDLLKEYLALLVNRKTDFRLLTISYMVKVMQELGVFPDTADMLLTGLNDDILTTIDFIAEQPLGRMVALTLEGEKEATVFGVVKAFAHEYLELGTIKSERML